MAADFQQREMRMRIDHGAQLGTILGVWGHPDDETWLTAALMAQAVEAGHRVVCVTATRGEAGFPDDDPRSLAQRAAIREAELAESLAALGVTEHHYLGYADGGCAAVDDDEAVAAIRALIDDVRPDVVMTFGPDGATGHGDHVAACRWSTLAVDATPDPRPRLLYATKSPAWVEEFFAAGEAADVMMIEGLTLESTGIEDLALYLVCDDTLLDRKVDALLAQHSQMDDFVATIGIDAFRRANREEFFRDPRDDDTALLAFTTERSRA